MIIIYKQTTIIWPNHTWTWQDCTQSQDQGLVGHDGLSSSPQLSLGQEQSPGQSENQRKGDGSSLHDKFIFCLKYFFLLLPVSNKNIFMSIKIPKEERVANDCLFLFLGNVFILSWSVFLENQLDNEYSDLNVSIIFPINSFSHRGGGAYWPNRFLDVCHN